MMAEQKKTAKKKKKRIPRCSIVIRAFNEEQHIGKLLTGIMQQTEKNVEIILVDSGSTDATVAIASRFPVKIVQINPRDFTFGYSLNQGIAKAQGEFIVIVSAHVYPVYPDWLEQLLLPFNDAQIGLTYGKQRGNKTSKFPERQIFEHWFPDESIVRQGHPFCNNANAAIRRSLWQKHPYDETLTGLEDLEWANWVTKQGYSIAYVAEAEIIHVHNETPNAVYNRYRREAMAFKNIFPDETFRLWDFARLYVSNVFRDAQHAAREKLLSQVLGEIVWFRLMQFWGTYRGYKSAGPVNETLRKTFYYPRGTIPGNDQRTRNVSPIDYREKDGVV